MIIIFTLILGFNRDYQNFIDSPRSESIFVTLMHNRTKLNDYKSDPVILWFWRSRTNDPQADSFLKTLTIPRNSYLAGVLRWEAKDTKELQQKYEKIKLAIHFDSLAIENFLSLLSLGLSTRNLSILKTAFSLPILKDFRNQIFLLGNFIMLLFLALFFNLFVFLLIKFIYYLPVLSHRLDPLKHNLFKGMLGFAFLLIPSLVLRNFYLTFLIYGIILIFIFNTQERNYFRLCLFLLLLFSLFATMFNFVPFLKGKDKTYYLYQLVALDSDIRINPESELEKEILAYAYKKQAMHDEALALYEDLYYNLNNHRVDVVNNLANLYAIYEEDERAEELYRRAMVSDRGEPYFNLALLKYKKIEYLAAGELMEEARKRGCVRAQNEPIDIVPETKVFYNLLFTPHFSFSSLVKNFHWIVLLLVLLFTFVPSKFSPPYRCAICRRPVCRQCAEEVGEEFHCQDCINKLNATKNEAIEEELRQSLGRTHRLLDRFLKVFLNILLPGAGLIYKNKNFLGMVFTFLAVIVYIPFFFKSYLIKPAGWIALSLTPIIIVVGVVILFFCYLFSFLFLLGGNDAD